MAGYIVVKFGLAEDREEGLANLLSEYPVLGARIDVVGNGLVSVQVYSLASEAGSAGTFVRALTALGGTDVRVEWLAERDWLDEYRRQAQPFPVGMRWWIDPVPGATSVPPAGRMPLVVEPSSAFGSGSHESTQLMLCHLEQVDAKGRQVLDVGAGSGILGIAAHRLGAEWVVGVDVDLRAAFVARRTFGDQTPPVSVQLVAGTLAALARQTFDTILCNMLWESQRNLLPDLRRLLARPGSLVLSGFLRSDEREVVAQLEEVRLVVVGRRELGDWLLLEAGHG